MWAGRLFVCLPVSFFGLIGYSTGRDWGVAKRYGIGFWIRHSEVRILPPQPFLAGVRSRIV
jgi:hypothetical protein